MIATPTSPFLPFVAGEKVADPLAMYMSDFLQYQQTLQEFQQSHFLQVMQKRTSDRTPAHGTTF